MKKDKILVETRDVRYAMIVLLDAMESMELLWFKVRLISRIDGDKHGVTIILSNQEVLCSINPYGYLECRFSLNDKTKKIFFDGLIKCEISEIHRE